MASAEHVQTRDVDFKTLLAFLACVACLFWVPAYDFAKIHSAEAKLRTKLHLVPPEKTPEQVQQKRLARMRDTCKKYGLEQQQQQVSTGLKSLLVEKRNKIAYCVIAKSGSTTWTQHLLNLTGYDFAETRPRIGKKRPNLRKEAMLRFHRPFSAWRPDDVLDFLDDEAIFLFAFVRHPFERLVSAFEDKILLGRDPNFSALSRRLRRSFVDFARHVLNEAREKGCDHVDCSRLNKHWRPYNARCSFCSLPYSMLGKLETYFSDLEFLLDRRSELRGVLSPSLNANETPLEERRGDDTMRYFAKLSWKTRRELYRLYEMDFEMFGYSAEEYLKKDL